MSRHSVAAHLAAHLGEKVSHCLQVLILDTPSWWAVEFHLEHTSNHGGLEFVYVALTPSGGHAN